MVRIKITDLPTDLKITKEEMKRVKGGIDLIRSTSLVNTSLKIDGTTYYKYEDPTSLAIAGVDTFGKI